MGIKSFEEFLSEKFVIKHKETGEVLSTHDDEASAKDEHSGLSDKTNYKVVKSKAGAKKFGMKE